MHTDSFYKLIIHKGILMVSLLSVAYKGFIRANIIQRIDFTYSQFKPYSSFTDFNISAYSFLDILKLLAISLSSKGFNASILFDSLAI